MNSPSRRVSALESSICLNRVFFGVGFFVLLTLLIVVWAEEISRIARNNAEDVYRNGLTTMEDAPTPLSSSSIAQSNHLESSGASVDTPLTFNEIEILNGLVVAGNLTLNGQQVLTVCTDDSACPALNACQQSLCLESFANDAVICVAAPRAPGGACDDGLANTLNDVCVAGGVCRGTPMPSLAHCTPLEENECSDAPDCQMITLCVRADDESTCFYAADSDSYGQTCDDHNPFTINDACNAAGKCVGTPVQVYTRCSAQEQSTCPEAATNGCVDISCAKLAGDVRCLMDAREDGIECDDNNANTHNDACKGGVCVGERPCTTTEIAEHCEPAAQCRAVDCTRRGDSTFDCSNHNIEWQNGKTCDDNNAATEADVCVDGECRGFAVPIHRPCTVPEVKAHCERPAPCRKMACALLQNGNYACDDVSDASQNGKACDANNTCYEGQCAALLH